MGFAEVGGFGAFGSLQGSARLGHQIHRNAGVFCVNGHANQPSYDLVLLWKHGRCRLLGQGTATNRTWRAKKRKSAIFLLFMPFQCHCLPLSQTPTRAISFCLSQLLTWRVYFFCVMAGVGHCIEKFWEN